VREINMRPKYKDIKRLKEEDKILSKIPRIEKEMIKEENILKKLVKKKRVKVKSGRSASRSKAR